MPIRVADYHDHDCFSARSGMMGKQVATTSELFPIEVVLCQFNELGPLTQHCISGQIEALPGLPSG